MNSFCHEADVIAFLGCNCFSCKKQERQGAAAKQKRLAEQLAAVEADMHQVRGATQSRHTAFQKYFSWRFAPHVSRRIRILTVQVRLEKAGIEPVILAPSLFPLYFGGGGERTAVRAMAVGARRRRPRRAASRADAAHDARGLPQEDLRQREERRCVAR